MLPKALLLVLLFIFNKASFGINKKHIHPTEGRMC